MHGSAPSRLVSDCGGLIEEVAMTIPQRVLQTSPHLKAAALGKLVESLPADVTLYLMTDDPSTPLFRSWYEQRAFSAVPIVMGIGDDAPLLDSEMWSQDPWMAAEQDGRLLLHHLRYADRPGRQARWLSAHRRLAIDAPSLQLAGGNTLTGPDFRILGTQSIELTRRIGQDSISFEAALARHRALDPRPIHIFGFPLPARGGAPIELRQQPHHLDLVLSLTGKVTAAGKHLLLLADPRGTLDPDGPRMPGWAEQLDATAERLAADGFAVLRNKVPYLSHPAYAPNPSLRAYNNVMLENAIRTAKSRPLVWLPHFGDLEPDLGVYDDANRAVWESLGFEVVAVPGWSALVQAGGALRCASKVLRRGVAPAPILT
jgi:hypothetical protein